MDQLQKTDPETSRARLKAQGDDLRHRYSTGHYSDNLPPLVPGIPNTSAMVEAAYLDHLESIGQLQADERPRLRELRLESLRDQTRLLGERLERIATQTELNADSWAEGISVALATSGRLKALLEKYETDRLSYESDWELLWGVIGQLFGQEKVDEAIELISNQGAKDHEKDL